MRCVAIFTVIHTFLTKVIMFMAIYFPSRTITFARDMLNARVKRVYKSGMISKRKREKEGKGPKAAS